MVEDLTPYHQLSDIADILSKALTHEVVYTTGSIGIDPPAINRETCIFLFFDVGRYCGIRFKGGKLHQPRINGTQRITHDKPLHQSPLPWLVAPINHTP